MVESFVKNGIAQFVYVPYLSSHAGADVATRGAYCALEQGKFWAAHDAFFAQLAPYSFTEESVIQVAAGLGMDQSVFLNCLYSANTETFIGTVADFIAVQRDLGNFAGTPTVLINGDNPFERGFVPQWAELRQAIEAAAQ